MNKTELITAIAESADISKKDSEKALSAIAVIKSVLFIGKSSS